MDLGDSGHSTARIIQAARNSGALIGAPPPRPPLIQYPPSALFPNVPPNLLPQPPLHLPQYPLINHMATPPYQYGNNHYHPLPLPLPKINLGMPNFHQFQNNNYYNSSPPPPLNVGAPFPTPSILATQTSEKILSQMHLSPQQRGQASGPYPYTGTENDLGHESTGNDDVFQVLLLYDTDDKINVDKYPIITQFQSLSLEQQLTSFFRSQELSENQMRIRWQIAFDTEHIVRAFYPNCQVYVFGSLLTGLANPSSDVDMYADLFGDDGRLVQEQKCPETAAADLRDDVHALIYDNNTCPHSRVHPFAQEMHRIGGTRVPVLRFSHGCTGVKCDISFGNRISVQNSKLLIFYLKYDPCVGPLLLFLRYWAHFHGISGGIKIKQYALALMALVFLMKKGILPSVSLLQSLQREVRRERGTNMNPDQIEGWDASFCENRAVIDKVFTPATSSPTRVLMAVGGYPYSDPQHFMELILDFFAMYGDLKMSEQVISPLKGDMISRNDFMVEAMEMAKQRAWWGKAVKRNFGEEKLLCIQDPFVQTFNVAEITKDGTVKTFQNMCALTHQRMNPKRGKIRSILGFFMAAEPEDEYPELVKKT